MSWRSPDTGDWIRTTKTIPLTLTDAVLGGGLPRGTQGVVNRRAGSRVTADFATGFGTITATVDASSCRVERRGGGRDAFRDHVRLMTVVRLALAAFLSWPIVQFVGVYVWTHHSFDGIAGAFVVGVVDGFGDWLIALVQHPLSTVVYVVFLALLSKVAFRR